MIKTSVLDPIVCVQTPEFSSHFYFASLNLFVTVFSLDLLFKSQILACKNYFWVTIQYFYRFSLEDDVGSCSIVRFPISWSNWEKFCQLNCLLTFQFFSNRYFMYDCNLLLAYQAFSNYRVPFQASFSFFVERWSWSLRWNFYRMSLHSCLQCAFHVWKEMNIFDPSELS